jgi:hypothetical protein
MSNKCALCFKLSNKTCSNCRQITYCSLPCQQADWQDTHKFVCTPKADQAKENKLDQAIKAIVFYTDGSIKFNNVQYTVETYDDSPAEAIPDLKKYFQGYIGSNLITKHPYTPDQLENSFFIFYNDNFLNENHNPNTAIHKITQQRHGHDWRGTVVAIKIDRCITSKSDEHAFINFDMSDVNIIKNYLTWYGSSMCKNETETNRKRLEKLFPESVLYL